MSGGAGFNVVVAYTRELLGKLVGCASEKHESGVNNASFHEEHKGLTGLVS